MDSLSHSMSVLIGYSSLQVLQSTCIVRTTLKNVILTGRTSLICPYVSVYSRLVFMTSSLFLQLYPACLAHLYEKREKWPDTCYFVGCCFLDFFLKAAHSIFVFVDWLRYGSEELKKKLFAICYFVMIDNQSIVVQFSSIRMLASLSAVAILLPRCINWSAKVKGLQGIKYCKQEWISLILFRAFGSLSSFLLLYSQSYADVPFGFLLGVSYHTQHSLQPDYESRCSKSVHEINCCTG